jgi:hypothetical protein
MSAQPDPQYDDQPERRRPFSTLLSSLSPHSGDDRETAVGQETAVDQETTVGQETTGADEDFETAPRPTFTARAEVPDAAATEAPATAYDLDPVDDTTNEPVSGTVYEAESADEPLDDAVDDDDVPVVVTDEAVTEDVYDEPVDDVAATSAPVPPAPRANGEALPGFRRASTDGDSARAFPKHAAPDVVDEPVTGTVPVDPELDAPELDAPVPSATPATSASVVDEPLLSDAGDFRARWQQTQAGFVDDPRQAVGEAADLIEQTAQALVVAVRQRQRLLRESWDATPEAHGTDPASLSDTEQLRLMMQRYRALFNQLCRP